MGKMEWDQQVVFNPGKQGIDSYVEMTAICFEHKHHGFPRVVEEVCPI